jgi:hypothetical protein
VARRPLGEAASQRGRHNGATRRGVLWHPENLVLATQRRRKVAGGPWKAALGAAPLMSSCRALPPPWSFGRARERTRPTTPASPCRQSSLGIDTSKRSPQGLHASVAGTRTTTGAPGAGLAARRAATGSPGALARSVWAAGSGLADLAGGLRCGPAAPDACRATLGAASARRGRFTGRTSSKSDTLLLLPSLPSQDDPEELERAGALLHCALPAGLEVAGGGADPGRTPQKALPGPP